MRDRVRFRPAVVLGLSALAGLGALAEAQPAAPTSPPGNTQSVPVFGVESSLVLLDVVVRDKGGRLVRDLKADEFEVYEDGRPQALSAFDIVNREVPAARFRAAGVPEAPNPAVPMSTPASAPEAAEPPAEGQVPGLAEPVVIAFVFDRLSAEGRDRADKAARLYSDKGHVPGDVVGVFVIDQALHTLLPFSTDLAEVRTAFDRAKVQAHTTFSSSRATARDATDRAMGIEESLDALGLDSGSALARARAAELGSKLVAANMQARMERMVDRIERDQQGYASTNGLLAVVTSLKAVPGRKTIVFFSEGLTISGNVQAQFESLAAVANRVNVTVYAVDAGGLRVESGTREARLELTQLATLRLRALSRPTEGGGPLMQGLERSEDMLSLNPHVRLGELAEDTGGFLVANTNDASDGFRRLQEEMRFYYLLSYAPSHAEFDGKFRNISVSVKRRGVKVHSRKGYLALPPVPRPIAVP